MAAKKTTKKKTAPPKKKINNQAYAILIFAFGILMVFLTLIKGSDMWETLHKGIFGLFGISAYLVSPIIIYASIMLALEKEKSAVTVKLLQGAILILLVSAVAQIMFVGEVVGETFFARLKYLYTSGINSTGGGLASAVIGMPLLVLFGKSGAAIIVWILTATFFILLANVTLIQFFKFIAKPFTYLNKCKNVLVSEVADDKKVNTSKSNNDVQVDFAKYINDETSENVNKKEKKSKKKEKIIVEKVDDTQEGLPVHPVVSQKANDNKAEALQEIINKAAPITNKVESNENKKESQIFVDSDGQTSLCENDNSVNLYCYPSVNLLQEPIASNINEETQKELKHNSQVLVDTLKSFGVQTRIVDINRGPSVTRYELQPAAGVKVSKITNLTDDIKMSLAAKSIRIEAPIPGKAAVGIEVPNKDVDLITMREILESDEFMNAKSRISFALGKDITGNTIIADIAKMPHVLIAGATGSGKSVCINSIIISLLYKSSPDDVRMLMIDPKMVELEVYNGIPHLLIPVVTDSRKAAGALSWAVAEMQKRYKIFADNNVRNLEGYNDLANKTDGMEKLPQIVIIIDELADLMMVAAKDVEEAICRLAQLARAAGMHLVIATQRPSVDIITGVIKANIPSRIAFSVSSQIDSRTILDSGGAEKLLGRGDMLFSNYGSPMPTRVQGCFVTDKEVETVVKFVKDQVKADYDEKILDEIEKNTPVQKGETTAGGSIDSGDEMLEAAISAVVEAGQASTSYLQRKLKLGYARAARIMDQLEEIGIVGAQDGSKPRKVLMTKEQWYESQVAKNNL